MSNHKGKAFRTIIFDVDDTLYDQALSFHKTFQKMVAQDFSYHEMDQIYKVSRKYSEILFDKSEKGEISKFEWQTGRILHAFNDFNIPIDRDKAALIHEEYMKAQGEIVLFPEIKKLLDMLKDRDCQLAILTNGEEKHQTMKMDQLQLTNWIAVENIFISGSYRYAKPKSEIFHIVEEKLACNPENTVYIGDSFEKDIIGAKQVGWKAIWMNHRRRNIPEQSPYLPDEEFYHAKELLDYFQMIETI